MRRKPRDEEIVRPVADGPSDAPTRRRRRTRKVTNANEPETSPVAVVEVAPNPPRRMRVSIPDDAPPIPGYDQRPPEPKRRGRRPKSAESAEPKPTPAPRRGRSTESAASRRRTKPEPVEERLSVEELEQFLPAPAVARPRREQDRWERAIAAPKGAPRVGVANGQPVLILNEQVVIPHFFFGNIHSEASEKAVLSQIAKAAENGVRLFSLFLELPIDMNAEEAPADEAERLLDSVLQVAPDAWVMFRTVFSQVKGWTAKYPDAVYRYPDGTLADPSICAKDWWTEAEACLKKLVTEVGKHKGGDRVLGYHLERGEWFNGPDLGYDDSPAAQEAFRRWVKDRYYGDIVALRASWHDGTLDFSDLRVPKYGERIDSDQTLLTERKERRWVDYHEFLSDAYVERIGKLARVVKETSKGALLVGCSYGYTFEFSHPHSGHLSLARLLKCPDVDLIAGPPTYSARLPGGAAPFPAPIDSVGLAGKLYIIEEDYKTGLRKKDEADDFNPALENPQALEAAHWRGFGMAMAHSAGISWMDTWGNGWLDTRSIWSRAEQARKIWAKRYAEKPSAPEVAVLIDERSMGMLQQPHMHSQLIEPVREAVLRSGVTAGFYLLSDLTRADFPSCKLYLFLNAWDIGEQVRTAIKDKLHRGGKTLMWWYAAAIMEYHKPAMDRIREVTGIALKHQPFASRPGTTITQKRHLLTDHLDDNAFAVDSHFEPTYFAVEEDCQQLGEYTDTGLPSFVVREVNAPGSRELAFRSVFLGEPVVSPTLIRGLCKLAGVRIWDTSEDVAHINPPFLTLHAGRGGRRTVSVPSGWEMRDALGDEQFQDASFNIQDGTTKILLIGEPAELDALENAALPEAPEIVRPPPQRRLSRRAPRAAAPEPIFHLDLEEEAPPVRGPEPAQEKPGRPRRAPRRPRASSPAPAPAPEPTSSEEFGVTFRFRKKS